MNSLPVALTIAGSDSSAGAGLQADLKTFAAFEVFGICAATSVVAEIPGKVTGFETIDPTLLDQQLNTVESGFKIAAVKTGMLATPKLVSVVCRFLERHPGIPAVIDPVMVATSGDRLLDESAEDLYRDRLLPRADVVTPNLAEAEVLLGSAVGTLDEMRDAAEEFTTRFGCGAVVLKGGHLPESDDAIDLFLGEGVTEEFSSARIPDMDTHGTGCTLSAAIAAGLARGCGLRDSVATSKQYITEAIRQSYRWSNGITALNHFPEGVTFPAP